MSGKKFFNRLFGLLASALLPACAGLPARHMRADIAAGRAPGAWVAGVPFERQQPGRCGPAALASLLNYWGRPATQAEIGREIYSDSLKGTLGFDLWRYARKAGLVSLEAQNLDPAALDTLLGQGVPVLLNLNIGIGKSGGTQHYVLLTGHDRRRRLWAMQDGIRPDRLIPDSLLMGFWGRTGRWALIAFPPEQAVKGLGPDLHIQTADRLEEMNQAGPELRHVEEALKARPDASDLWLRAGLLHVSAGRAATAEKDYRTAIAIDPQKPDAYNNLADLLARSPSRLAEAEGLARRAVALCGAFARGELRLPYALDTLGTILVKEGKRSEAKAAYQSALSMSADFPVAEEIRGHLAAF